MKKIIKKILPIFVIKKISKLRMRFNVLNMYRYDIMRFFTYAYDINKSFSEDNLRSKITFHYHAIEKGLTNSNIRLGFGKTAFTELFWTMDQFIEYGYSTNDSRFQSAISVIKSYIDLHKAGNFPINNIETKYINYSKFINNERVNSGGYKIFKKDELPQFCLLGFKELSQNRFSVRDFGNEVISDDRIFSSIEIATKTPSVCNRQAWKVYLIKSNSKVKEVLRIQGGFSNNGENLQSLILVTSDKQYMNNGQERNQTYIDGGLFTMSLLYALESENIASCTLNASFNLTQEREIRKLLGIGFSQDLISFIAIGSYPEVFRVAVSPRDSYSQFTKVIE